MRVKKTKRDRVLKTDDSPILDEWVDGGWLGESQAMAVTGQLNIGKNGNPVTVIVEDEVTGEVLEVNHVQSALVVVEDKRKSTNGWLSVVIGSPEKVSEVLEFIAKTTLEGLKKIFAKN